jgi:hypothetical protein
MRSDNARYSACASARGNSANRADDLGSTLPLAAKLLGDGGRCACRAQLRRGILSARSTAGWPSWNSSRGGGRNGSPNWQRAGHITHHDVPGPGDATGPGLRRGLQPAGGRIRRKVTGRIKVEVRDRLRELHLQVESGPRSRRRCTAIRHAERTCPPSLWRGPRHCTKEAAHRFVSGAWAGRTAARPG